MVMTKQFHSIGGIIIGETSTGSPRVDYLTDALGSVTATVNQSAQVVNTYRYKPFGATLAKTGTGPDPAFGWAGTHGYRPTGNPFSNFYVMFRHYDDTSGRWPTVDPIGFGGGDWNPYRYVGNEPIVVADPLGLQGGLPACNVFVSGLIAGQLCSVITALISNWSCVSACPLGPDWCACSGSVKVQGIVKGAITLVPANGLTGPSPCFFSKVVICPIPVNESIECPKGEKCADYSTCTISKKPYKEHDPLSGVLQGGRLGNVTWSGFNMYVDLIVSGKVKIKNCVRPAKGTVGVGCIVDE